MFHLLAQAVRILHYCQGHGMTSLVKLSPRFSPTHGIFQALVRELKVLYEEEVKDMPQASTVSGTGVGVGVMDAGKFSSYLQAVFEAGLAVADVMPCESPPLKPAAPPSAEEAAPTPALSPTVATKKKKLKTKRERGASSAGGVIRRTPSTSPRASESESLESATSSTCSPPPAMASVVSETVGSSSSTTSGSSGAGIVTSPLPSLSSSNDSIKLEDISWFQRAILISRVLRYLGFAEDHCGADFDSFVQDVALSIQPSTAYSRIIVISGIPPQISPEVVKSALCKVCSSNGGIEHSEVFVPEISQRPHKQKGSSRTQAMSGQAETGSAVQEGSTDSTLFPPTDHQEQETDLGMQMTEQSPVSQSCDQDQASNSQACTQGFAVFSLMTKTKVEAVRKGLFRSKALMESLQLGGGLEQVDAPPDHSLAFSTVSPALLTDAEANQALEQYFVYKLFGNTREFTDEASQALTEIFYSCFFIDQQNSSPDCRQETGYICLGREQILQAAPENLLLAFFQNSRPAKKPIGDHVTWVLRQYGMSKSLDKDP